MPWFKVDDKLHDHAKARKAGCAAMGLWAIAGSWCADNLTDGFIPASVCARWDRTYRKMAIRLVDVGLWTEAVKNGEEGWQFHDWEKYQPTKAETLAERDWNRVRTELHRDKELVEAIKARDQDRCRYCGVQVDWKDRRGARGATYDHLIPRGPNTLDNIVVACRSCNTKKGARTPEDAVMPLLSAGSLGFVPNTYLDTNRNSTDTKQDPDPNPTRTRPDPLVKDVSDGPAAKPPPDAQRLIGEWIDHCDDRPPKAVIGQVAKIVAQLLTEGIPYDRVRNGVASWHLKGLHPSTIPSEVHIVRTAANRPRSTSDARVQVGVDLVAELRAEEALQRVAIGASE